MGFLNFYKKCKKFNSTQPLPKLDSNFGTCTEYNSSIANSFMVVGSSISDITQSSLSEEIFSELPLSGKSNYSSSSSDCSDTTLSKDSHHLLDIIVENSNAQDNKVRRQSNVVVQLDDTTTTTTTTTRTSTSDQEIHSESENSSSNKPAQVPPTTSHLNKKKPCNKPCSRTNPSPVYQDVQIDRMKERHRQEYRRSKHVSLSDRHPHHHHHHHNRINNSQLAPTTVLILGNVKPLVEQCYYAVPVLHQHQQQQQQQIRINFYNLICKETPGVQRNLVLQR